MYVSARFLLLVAFSCIVTVPFAAPAEEALPPGRDFELSDGELGRARQMQQEFQAAGLELAETHERALKQPELQQPLEELRAAMEAEMIRLAPEKKAQILRRYEVYRQMREQGKIERPTASDRENFEALLLEYANLNETIDDLPTQAAHAPPVRAAREKYHTALLAVMTGINPKVPELLKQQKKSIADYTELTGELLQKHGALPPAAEESRSGRK